MNLTIDISAIIGFIVSLLLIVIGYFLKRLVCSVDDMKVEICKTKDVMIRQQEKFNNFSNGCIERHGYINKTLDTHEKRIISVEKKVAVLEAE